MQTGVVERRAARGSARRFEARDHLPAAEALAGPGDQFRLPLSRPFEVSA
jgi:hypothetical protein